MRKHAWPSSTGSPTTPISITFIEEPIARQSRAALLVASVVAELSGLGAENRFAGGTR